MAKIYFYDCSEDESNFFKEQMVGHDCVYYKGTLETSPIHEDAEVISVFVPSQVSRNIINMMPKLQLIACRSAGYNNIDLSAARERNIQITTAPLYGEHTVAEYTFSLLLSLTRKIPLTIKNTKERAPTDSKSIQGIDITGKTLGVIGTGKIGKRVIEIAKGFAMNIVAYDPYPDNEASQTLGFKYLSLDEVCMSADIITLHTPLTNDTEHIINDASFAKMKDGVYIVNTARGELIDSGALLRALTSHKVAGAALDVVEGEKLLKETPTNTLNTSTKILQESFTINSLLFHPNVIITPHNAYNTKEAVLRIDQTTVTNILDFIAGKPTNIVDTSKQINGKLILVRHTESEYNKKSLWTGTRNVTLTEKGFEEARILGEMLKSFHIDKAYASEQIRTMETLSSILGAMQQPIVTTFRDKALNERDYGEYTGKNKDEMKQILGDEMFERVRRGWDVAIPGGETLKDVYNRITPYYKKEILSYLLKGENILVVSHGNALRALIKYIENINDADIEHVEMPFGNALVYTTNDSGQSQHKLTVETQYTHIDTVK